MSDARDEELPAGLYEQVIDADLQRTLNAAIAHGRLVQRTNLDDAEAPEVLAEHVSDVLRSALEDLPQAERIKAANSVIEHVGSLSKGAGLSRIVDSDTVLLGVGEIRPGLSNALPPRPEIPLSQSDILMNARGEPNLLSALISEMDSADHIRIIVSFIKWSGLRHLLPSLKRCIHRGARIQVLTTTYLGASDERAIRALADAGVEVRVSFDSRSTRLHAKSWLFDRYSGTHTGYIGSSNVSQQAMSEGQEWNVRLSQHETPHLLTKFRNAFDAYWAEPSFGFDRYDPASFPEDALRLASALAEERQSSPTEQDQLLPFEVRPYPYQQEILDALELERTIYGRTRNLVVAATGTGKTVISALDYARLWREGTWSRSGKGLPTLLFIAHRKEILEQSRRVFRQVLRDVEFGELLVDGTTPLHGNHVFASVQSLTAGERLNSISPHAYDIVIVDEFHHATARSWNAILRHLQPKILVGLTATPERSDGGDITDWFDHHVAAELRLWDALERDLLVPFHYFAVGSTELDFRKAAWSSGRYATQDLEQVYTGSDVLLRWVLEQIHDKVTEPEKMRALVFTSGIGHAEKTVKYFNRFGLRSGLVTGDTPKDLRRDLILKLRSGDLQALVTVDVFNEGIDIPEVDTVLMLRPTESLTVFLQQLGRGLRKADGKAVLTVLDFVGQHRKEFRFANRLTAMTGIARGGIERAIRSHFPYLPSGVLVRLDEVASNLVLDNIRDSIPTSARALAVDVAAHAQTKSSYTLTEYLHDADLQLDDIYGRPGRSWALIKQDAGLLERGFALNLERLRRVRSLAHVDDVNRISAYRGLLTDHALASSIGDLDLRRQRWAYMLYFSIFDKVEHENLAEGLLDLQRDHAFRDEVLELLDYREAHLAHITYPEHLAHPDSPLAVHASYSRAELLSAVGEGNWLKPPSQNREGVVHAKAIGADVFRMTWQKSERDYSPNTMYRDFAVSTSEIHWQSQHQDRQASPKIRRYVEHAKQGHRILLFARQSSKVNANSQSRTRPFMYLGDAQYKSHEGERPVSFHWTLHRPMPMDFARQSLLTAS